MKTIILALLFAVTAWSEPYKLDITTAPDANCVTTIHSQRWVNAWVCAPNEVMIGNWGCGGWTACAQVSTSCPEHQQQTVNHQVTVCRATNWWGTQFSVTAMPDVPEWETRNAVLEKCRASGFTCTLDGCSKGKFVDWVEQ